MQHNRTTRAALGLILGLCLSATAFARPAPSEAPPAAAAPAQPSPQEKADTELLQKALKDFQRSRYAGLGKHLPAMRAALDRATPSASDPEVYAYLSLLTGSFYVEMHQLENSVATLDKGLAIAPGHPALSSEKATALSSLRRFDESLATIDAALAAGGGGDQEKARLHRMRGVVLIDLKRLDDAEASLNKSLTLHPNHPVALNELKYIADIRKGATPADKPIAIVNSDEAAKPPPN